MKTFILLPAIAALVFSSCTSAYRTGQTPDDVYYSPTRPQDEYVQTEKRDDNRYRGSDEYYEDRYLRMRVQNRYRWSPLDDYYFNSPYAYNYSFYNSSWSTPYNSYWCWNNYYNPYYSGYSFYPVQNVIIVKNPTTYTRPSRPIAFNANSYSNNPEGTGTRANKISNSYNSNRNAGYNNNNSSRYNNSNTFGNSLRKVFSNSNSSSNSSNSTSTPSRSYTPSSSNSSSGSSRSSGSSSSSSSSSSGGSSRPSR
jgi:hypothetical protein